MPGKLLVILEKENTKMDIMKKVIRITGVTLGVLLLSAGQVVHAQNFADALESEKTEASIDQTALSQAAALQKPSAIPGAPSALEDSTYTLGINDVIDIAIARHPEVSGQYMVNGEGKIQYGFVGDIAILGLTKKEIKDILTEHLSTYIVSPDVTITIAGYNSKMVYVIGEVGVPGRIYMRGDTITVREALLQAGLPLLSASTAKCRLITPAPDGLATIKYVNVFKLLYEGDLREDLAMKPGDTLYIPATILAKAMRVIQPVSQPIGEAGSVARPIATGGF